MSTIDPVVTLDACTHGDGCPVHPSAWGVHNFDPACGWGRLHDPHRIALVDADCLVAGYAATDVPVYSRTTCGGGHDPQRPTVPSMAGAGGRR